MASKAQPKKGAVPTPEGVCLAAPSMYGLSCDPLHLNVASPEDRRTRNGVVCHSINTSLPSYSYYRIEPSLYVCTPEAALLQSANNLSIAQLAMAVCELCGYYSCIDESLEMSPRTSVGKIAAFLNRCSESSGARSAKLRKALRYAVDGSASVMETRLAMLLCMSTWYGGYGIPLPVMNHPVKLKNKAGAMLPVVSRTLKCDLTWPSKRFALEYDSDLHHASQYKLNHDSKRRAKIEMEHLHVITVTKEQMYDVIAFDEMAHAAAYRLGVRLRTARKDAMERKLKLRAELGLT